MDKATRKEYDRMRAYGVGGVVGEDARICLALARARVQFDQRDDVTIVWDSEQECYEDVYGTPAPEGFEYYCVVVRIGREVMASLGFVDDDGSEQSRQYGRIVENELLSQAFAEEGIQRARAEQRACFC